MENCRNYEVAIIGAGISGTALAYLLSRYTDIESIAIIEKYGEIAPLNTKGTSNSQTIHFGDIETNYTLEKAKITKRTAKMVEKYCLQHGYENDVIHSHQKMAFGVGEDEVEFLLNRYEEFSELFPNLEIYDRDKLKEIEPKLVFDENGKERTEPIIGVGSNNEWTTVDYGKMAETLVKNAKKEKNKVVDIFFNSEVKNIKKLEDKVYKYEISTPDEVFSAKFVVVNAGAHSLFLAHKMNYGKDLGTLPIAGSFYLTTKKLLNGKVYMVQNPKLPFAALHGDPDILANGFTRFGPTALLLPKLERYKKGTYSDFFKSLNFDSTIFKIFADLFKDSDIRNYIIRNILFEIPFISKKLFLKDARKIVPSLSDGDIEYAKGFGGVRPQVLSKSAKKLMLGEASINHGEGIIFNMTPSPGATSCFGNGLRDLREVVKNLDKKFDENKFNSELIENETSISKEAKKDKKEFTNKIREEMHKHEEKYFEPVFDGKKPDYWDKDYNPWRNRKDSWSF